MSPIGLHNELVRIGRKLNRWQGEIRAMLWISIVLGSAWLFALCDLALRYQRFGRIATWSIMLAMVLTGLWHILTALRKKRSIQAVAARIEHAFPALDNHLINTIQFASHAGANGMEDAYVAQGVSGWNLVDVRVLRDRKKQVRSCLLLGVACLAMLASYAWGGATWTNALLRVLNPFSSRPPFTLAIINSVTPGDTAVIKGTQVMLSCSISGKKGQEVLLDMWPADDKKTTIKVGRLAGTGVEDFPFLTSKLTTDLTYLFRAGDAVSRRYRIQALVPLAFTDLKVTVVPPEYTQLESRSFDALAETIPVPYGSLMTFSLECNRDITSAALTATNAEPVKMAPSTASQGGPWKGSIALTGQKSIAISAVDPHGTTAEAALKYEILPDLPPSIRIIAPTVETIMSPGMDPRIEFEVSDDFGLSVARLEQITIDEQDVQVMPSQNKILHEWRIAGTKAFATNWTGNALTIKTNEPLMLRIVAVDNAAGEPNRAQSPPIVFNWTSADNIEARKKDAADKASAKLVRLVELQRSNLDKTTKLTTALATVSRNQWEEAAATQETIRTIAGQLITNPTKPLGGLTTSVGNLYHGAMTEVIDVLKRVPFTDDTGKDRLSRQAVMLETQILRILTRVNGGIDQVERGREITGLLAMLDSLVKGQETTLASTHACVKNPSDTDKTLAQKQDQLSDDLAAFIQSCRNTAKTQSLNDPEFGKMVTQIADGCERKKVSENMLRAAEYLEKKAPAKAIPPETEVLTTIKEFQKLMNDWRVQDATEAMDAFRQALRETSKKFDKLAKIEANVAEAIRETTRQDDKSDKETDELDEEINALHEQMKEAMLQIARDLQIFPELPVGNDRVEDVFQVFEEMEQRKGSEKDEAMEWGLQKEDWIMDAMEAMKDAKERIDDVEMWLPDRPDNIKRNTEAFDQEEMPEIPVIPMSSEMEDIIGDLLDIQEDIAEESDDSATNQGLADAQMGWNIEEGEFVNYSAKGKSGSERPDHKEQDGRSNIGRQGMSDGETAAGSGKIGEGDEKIEKRITQDPSQSGQVAEEDHSDAKATGGGKQSGYGEEFGMAGTGPRRDSKVTQGSDLGMQAMLKRNAQVLYARAQLSHVRTGSLDEAVHYMQKAEDAIAGGGSIQQVREFQRRAAAALKKTQTELSAEVMPEAIDLEHSAPSIEDQLAGARDEAPSAYRTLVSEYFKSLGGIP